MKQTTVHDGFFKLVIVDRPEKNHKEEVLVSTDSVSLLVHNIETNEIYLVRQSRVPVILSGYQDDGMVTELVAGRFDVDLGPKALAVKEAQEEIGATIPEEDIELMNDGKPLVVSAGAMTSRSYLAYAQIRSDQIEQEDRVFGAEDESEEIERITLSVDDLENYECEDLRVWGMIQFLLRRLGK